MRDLTIYRLDSAQNCLESADILLTAGLYRGSINRSYYAVFHSMRAILAEDEVNFKKHSAVISYFRREYIKTGIFDTKFSDYIGDAFRSRNNSDYEDFFVASRQDAEIQYKLAVEFYEAVRNYLEAIP